MPLPAQWFCALLDSAPDVYFRYAIDPERRLAYVSPSIEALTGHAPAAFYADVHLCAAVLAAGERHLLRRVLRSRRGLTLALHVVRDNVLVPIELRTVAVVRRRRVVAVEGVARLQHGAAQATLPQIDATPQRLAALMYEVHSLLHRVLPAGSCADAGGGRVLTLGALALNVERLIVTESGQPVALTSREVLLLRYLLERVGRVVTRRQLLTDVWNYRFTGDDRTVDVHVSRLRRKLPSLCGRLVAIRGIGYRLADGTESHVDRREASVRPPFPRASARGD